MDRLDFVVETLRHVLPHETDFIGDATVREIAAGPVEVLRAEHGSNLDLSGIIVAVAAVATAIRHGIEIYEKVLSARARRVSAEELQEAIEAAPTDPATASLSPEHREKIVQYLSEHLSAGSIAELPGTTPRREEGGDVPHVSQ